MTKLAQHLAQKKELQTCYMMKSLMLSLPTAIVTHLTHSKWLCEAVQSHGEPPLILLHKCWDWLKSHQSATFEKLNVDLAPEAPRFRVLCLTCCTVQVVSQQSVVDNYEFLLLLWQEVLDGSLDGEVQVCVTGVQTLMVKFEFLLGGCLRSLILYHADNLSKTSAQDPVCSWRTAYC